MPRAQLNEEEEVVQFGDTSPLLPLSGLRKYHHGLSAELAYRLCLLNCTDLEICEVLGITPASLSYWQRDYPKFKAAMVAGRTVADAEIAHALYHKAKGYTHKAEEIIFDRVLGTWHTKEYMKHYPPDTTAAMAFLSNRRKGKENGWRNTQAISDADGGNLGPVTFNILPVAPIDPTPQE
jgi:hypothetical protein